jgi:hypothetical protein
MKNTMIPEQKAIDQFMQRSHLPHSSPCGCMGPQGDEPLCPCAMQWTEVVDGDIYQITILGSPIRFEAKKVEPRIPYKEPINPLTLSLKERLLLKHKKN